MVSTKAPSYSDAAGVVPDSIRCVGDRRAKTRNAARSAARIAKWIDAEVGTNNPDSKSAEVDDHTLFAALQTCAYQATRTVRGRPAKSGEPHGWAHRWRLIRDYLINRHLGLTIRMLASFQTTHVDRDDLRSEAYMALIRATAGFNPWRGFRFSTYACHAIVRSLIQAARKASRHRLQIIEEPEVGPQSPRLRNDTSELYVDRLRVALDENRGELTERETTILAGRFPANGGPGRTLAQIGDAIDLSKERVRQIQKSALTKLRGVLEADPVMQ